MNTDKRGWRLDVGRGGEAAFFNTDFKGDSEDYMEFFSSREALNPRPSPERRKLARDDASTLCVIRGLAFKLCVEKATFHPHGMKNRVKQAFTEDQGAGGKTILAGSRLFLATMAAARQGRHGPALIFSGSLALYNEFFLRPPHILTLPRSRAGDASGNALSQKARPSGGTLTSREKRYAAVTGSSQGLTLYICIHAQSHQPMTQP